MVIMVDTREKKMSHITQYFDKSNIRYEIRGLKYGDYSFYIPKNEKLAIYEDLEFSSKITIERKASLTELSGNLTQGRDRFERELAFAPKTKVIVVENANYSDIITGNYRTKYNSKSYWASIHSIWHKYDVPVIFIPNNVFTGSFIQGYLTYYLKNYLKQGEIMRNEKSKIFASLIETFENDDIKEFAVQCIETIPDYFWEVGASSTAKYHPQYALGELGLARHTCALVRILNHVFSVDCWKNEFTSRERDLIRVAGIMHDSRKSGDSADYAKSKFTKFTHPLLAAEVIRSMENAPISAEEIELVATTMEAHMGQWNTDKRSSVVLPTPENKCQKILHLADYLASRKDIELLFGDNENPSLPALEDYHLDFGKHNGKTLKEVAACDPGWITWAKENINREPVKSLLKQM